MLIVSKAEKLAGTLIYRYGFLIYLFRLNIILNNIILSSLKRLSSSTISAISTTTNGHLANLTSSVSAPAYSISRV